MPRVGRRDAPGLLQHIMIRGIERRTIVRDATDREEFLARVARLAHLVERVAALCQRDPREVVADGRQRSKVTARSLLCDWAVREVGLPITPLARQLGLSPPGVSYAVQRGEALVREQGYHLVG